MKCSCWKCLLAMYSPNLVRISFHLLVQMRAVVIGNIFIKCSGMGSGTSIFLQALSISGLGDTLNILACKVRLADFVRSWFYLCVMQLMNIRVNVLVVVVAEHVYYLKFIYYKRSNRQWDWSGQNKSSKKTCQGVVPKYAYDISQFPEIIFEIIMLNYVSLLVHACTYWGFLLLPK